MRSRRAWSPRLLVAVLVGMACGTPTWNAGSGDASAPTAGTGGHFGAAGTFGAGGTYGGDLAGTYGRGETDGGVFGPGGRLGVGGTGGSAAGGRAGPGNGVGGRAGGVGSGGSVGAGHGGGAGSGAGASGLGGAGGGGGRNAGGSGGRAAGGSGGQGNVTYVGCTYIGGVDRLVVARRDLDRDLCINVVLMSPGPATASLVLPSGYGLDQAVAGPSAACPSRFPSGLHPTQVSGTVKAVGSANGGGWLTHVDVDITLTWPGTDGGPSPPEAISVTNLDVQATCP